MASITSRDVPFSCSVSLILGFNIDLIDTQIKAISKISTDAVNAGESGTAIEASRATFLEALTYPLPPV